MISPERLLRLEPGIAKEQKVGPVFGFKSFPPSFAAVILMESGFPSGRIQGILSPRLGSKQQRSDLVNDIFWNFGSWEI